MKPINFRHAAGPAVRRAGAVCLLVAFGYASAAAQTRATETPTPAPPRPATQAGPTADEDFELNIDVRRINEADFHAETEVEAGGASGLRLRVGVALAARDIDVLLQGVRGRVRFRASLAPVLRLLDARRGGADAPQSPPPPSP
ncbi:MAG TPA: hypothetical protein VF588_04285 [Pyrinomonadaceae bacterium]